MTETRVTYEGDLRCRAEHSGSGAVIVTDAPRDLDGLGEAFSPSELLSVSLGGCILSIMAIAARSTGFDIPGATVTVTKDMADRPRRIARMAVHIRVPGAFDTRQKRKLEAAAQACPVHHALAIDVPIAFEWDDQG